MKPSIILWIADPIEAIRFRMEQQGLSGKDFKPIGTRNRIAEARDRKRRLSIEMIRSLRHELGILADVLIRPTRHEQAV